ncbi:MAG: DeoR/GlpR family DNA-binding transcription regulator [Nocardioidaceae bacterium]
MKADERQRQILVRARADGRVEVGSLAIDLAVAEETVRRDLRELADRGVLQRVHGGAYPVESAGFESTIKHRSTSLVAEKRRIAAAAAARLQGAETVYIDEGVTPQFVAEALQPENPTTVVTSSLLAAGALADSSDVTVLLLGGRMRSRTLATVDHWALRMLDELVIDLAVLGANGISREHGLTTPDPAVAAVKTAVVARSRRRMFVGLHTKFGVSSFCRFAEVSDFEVLVTDSGITPGEARRFAVLGPQVVRA